MKAYLFLTGIVFFYASVSAQELYVATEPASNMPAHSIGMRVSNEAMFQGNIVSRTAAELMFGLNKNLMLHSGVYLSDIYQKQQRIEGFSLYGKYRFVDVDAANTHFRGAAFARYSSIKNPIINEAINLEGDNSGLQGGLIFTQLMHKLALSGSVSYTGAFDNRGGYGLASEQNKSIGYTISSGYLLFPKTYTSYKQTNLNLYLEFLGRTNPENGKNLMDLAPAAQFIFNSRLRLDLSRRAQLWGNMSRSDKNMYLIRFEYTLLNAL